MTEEQLASCGPPCCTFRVSHLPRYRFELRKGENAPDCTVALIYRRAGNNYRQSGVGYCDKGVWKSGKRGKPLDPDGLYWCEMVREDAA